MSAPPLEYSDVTSFIMNTLPQYARDVERMPPNKRSEVMAGLKEHGGVAVEEYLHAARAAEREERAANNWIAAAQDVHPYGPTVALGGCNQHPKCPRPPAARHASQTKPKPITT